MSDDAYLAALLSSDDPRAAELLRLAEKRLAAPLYHTVTDSAGHCTMPCPACEAEVLQADPAAALRPCGCARTYGHGHPIKCICEAAYVGSALAAPRSEGLDVLPADKRDPDLDFALRTYGDGIEEIGLRSIRDDRDLNDDELRAAAFLAANVIGHVYGFDPLSRSRPSDERGGEG